MSTHYMELSDNDILTMDDQTGDITISKEFFISTPEKGETVDIRYDEDSDDIIHRYQIDQLDPDSDNVRLIWQKQINHSSLVESPVVKLSDSELNNPNAVNLRNTISRAEEQERIDNENAIKKEKEQLLKDKYKELPEKLQASIHHNEDPVQTLEMLFEQLVPSSGPADSVAGELVRATMRLLFRDSNDGDKFFEGYGIETCGSSAEYLFDNGFNEDIESMLDDALLLSDDDDEYTSQLYLLTSHVIEHISKNEDLLWTINEEDSRDYSYDYIEEHQPRYEIDIEGSEDVVRLVERGVLTAWDLNRYVENWMSYESRYFNNAEISRPWTTNSTSVTVENLTRDGYEYLEDSISRNLEGFWEDLVSEYSDELNDSDYDDDYDYEED